MDYSKLSDFEINMKVAEIVVDYDCISRLPHTGMSVHWGDGANWHLFNPCNNPADAWPIIVENKISIYAAVHGDSRGEWGAEASSTDDYHFHDNPLRAAMLVFLMMQDSSHDNT